MRVGLYGGRFDPPHLGHLLAAEGAREALRLDAVWFLPTGDPPHKAAVAAAPHRLAMTRLATSDHPGFAVDDVEADRAGGTYALDTIEILSARHPEARFWYLIGADAFAEIASWHRAEELVRRVPMAVLPRPDARATPPGPPFADAATRLDTVPFGVSSTLVRERVAAGRSLRYLVPPPVVEYLHRHGLYARGTTGEGSE